VAQPTRDELLKDLEKIFREVLNNPKIVLTPESSALNTPGWDSIGHIEIVMMVERQYKIRFGLGELQDLKNVGELIELIEKKTSA